MSDAFVGFPPPPPNFVPWTITAEVPALSSETYFTQGNQGVLCVTNIDLAQFSSTPGILGAVYVTGTGSQRFFADENEDAAKFTVYMSWRGLHFLTQGSTLQVASTFAVSLGLAASGWWMPELAWPT